MFCCLAGPLPERTSSGSTARPWWVHTMQILYRVKSNSPQSVCKDSSVFKIQSITSRMCLSSSHQRLKEKLKGDVSSVCSCLFVLKHSRFQLDGLERVFFLGQQVFTWQIFDLFYLFFFYLKQSLYQYHGIVSLFSICVYSKTEEHLHPSFRDMK